MKQQNKKSETDYINIEDLKPNFKFIVPEDIREAAAHYPKTLKEYVVVHNEYISTKILEEKAKAKRPKKGDSADISGKFEFLDFDKELARNVNEVLVN